MSEINFCTVRVHAPEVLWLAVHHGNMPRTYTI